MYFTQIMSDEVLKIISLPVDDGGCGWYRIRQPFDMIKKHTPHDPHIISTDDDMIAVTQALAIADVVVFRPGGDIGIPALKEAMADYLKGHGKDPRMKAKWVLDIDDNTEMISPYSQHYEDYGVEEYFDKNINKWLWKDGAGGFNLEKNRSRLASLLDAMQKVDLVTVTTSKLAEYVSHYNKNVAVLPNCVNLEKWWKLDLKPNEQLRIGWSGGVSHYEDWYSIRKPLNKLMKEYQFKLVMAGSSFGGVIDEENKHLVEVHDWVPFKGHSYRMMCMALDIAIIPLANLPFNHYKSSIKWYEMNALGIPSVVSNTLPYREDILHEKNGILYKNDDEFYFALKKLIDNRFYRHNLGKEARHWVEQNRGSKECVNLWVDAYQKLTKGGETDSL